MSRIGPGRSSLPSLLRQNDQQTSSPPSFNPSSTSRDDSAYEETRDALITGFNIIREISEATELLGPLKSTCLLIVRGLEITRGVNNNKKAWATLTSRLERQLITVNDYQRRLKGHRCNFNLGPLDPLKEYARALEEILTEASKEEKRSKNLIKRMVRNTIDAEKIVEWTSRVSEAYERFTEAMDVLQWIQTTEQGIIIQEIRNDVKNLKRTAGEPLEDDSSFLEMAWGVNLEVCCPGTCTTILQRIREWVGTVPSKEQLFWLNDVAGTGKSTIANTVADELLGNNQLAGRFFFSQNSEGTSNLKRFCLTVARDIKENIPSIRRSIEGVIEGVSHSRFAFHRQFEKLLVEPLKQVTHTVVFVFDALDECDTQGHRNLLQLLLKHLPSISHVKALVTSRPSRSIKDILDSSPIVTGRDVQLYPIHNPVSNPDIAIYINHNWSVRHLTPEERAKLVDCANGLFIWAATACRAFEHKRRPEKLLKTLLDSEAVSNDMDGLYLELLKRALVDPEEHENFMDVLRIVVTAIEPVSISTIEIFLPENQSVNIFVQDLCSVMKDGDPHRPIHVLHPTFREFLSLSSRANGFLVEPSASHAMLARLCLGYLCKHLDYDMMEVRSRNGELPESNYKAKEQLALRFPQGKYNAMKYAIIHWAGHLMKSLRDAEVVALLRCFMTEKFLNWVEMLSICQLVPQGIEKLAELSLSLSNPTSFMSGSMGPVDVAFCEDALHFMQRHQDIITMTALHVYRSALPFSPPSSPVFQAYCHSNCIGMPQVRSGLPAAWSNHLPLNGHKVRIHCAPFSPDGTRIASGGMDGTLRIWDSVTGACLSGKPRWFRPHVFISIVIFSPDGETIVTDSGAHDLLVWDGLTGDLRDYQLVGHEANISSIAISPDGLLVASASWDKTIRLWRLENGECQSVLHPRFKGDWIRFVEFSPDGTILACGANMEIAIWEIRHLPNLLSPFRLCRAVISTLLFLPNMEAVLVGDEDGFLCLVYVNSSRGKTELVGHLGAISCAAIAPDSSYAVSGDVGGVVLIWDLMTASLHCSPAQVHMDEVLAIAFLPDGSKFITSSRDHTYRIWNVETGNSVAKVIQADGASMEISHISPKATQITAGYHQARLMLWQVEDMATQHEEQTVAHSLSITCLSVSEDGKTVASGSDDHMIRTWRTGDGHCTTQLVGHRAPIRCLQFSPCNHLLASGSDDCTVRVWNVITGASSIFSPEHRTSSALCVSFSSNSTRVGSGYEDGSIRIWEIGSGRSPTEHLGVHDAKVTCLCWYDDDRSIISASKDGTIRQWLVDTDQEVPYMLVRHPDAIQGMNVSADGAYFAYTTSTDWLDVWCLKPVIKHIGGNRFQSHIYEIKKPYFSQDHEFVFAGENVFRIWKEQLHLNSTHPPHPISELRLDYAGWVWNMHASVQWTQHKLFKLPQDIVIRQWIAYGNLIILGTGSGKVLIIACDPLL